MAKPKKVLSVWLPEALRDRFDEVCQMAGLGKAEVVEALIEWFLSKEGDNDSNGSPRSVDGQVAGDGSRSQP